MSDNENLPTKANEQQVPEDVLIILPVRNTVVFPGAVIPLTIGRRISLAAAEEAARSGRRIGLVMQKDPSVDEPAGEDLHPVGTIARVVRYLTARDGTQHVVCQGEQRFRVLDHIPGLPFMAARFDLSYEPAVDTAALEARARILKERSIEAIALLAQGMPELAGVLQPKGIGLGLLKPMPTITIDVNCTQGIGATKTIGAKIFFSKVTLQ